MSCGKLSVDAVYAPPPRIVFDEIDEYPGEDELLDRVELSTLSTLPDSGATSDSQESVFPTAPPATPAEPPEVSNISAGSII